MESGIGGADRDWIGYTPDGRRLVVRREGDGWVVTCDDDEPVRHRVLDVALIEAVRAGGNVSAHGAGIDYAEWTRLIADAIQQARPKPD